MTKSAALRVFAPFRPFPAIALLTLLFFAPALRAQTTWTGASGTSWATPGNWSPAAVPLATDTVVIPNTGNKPVITGSTAAVAKIVVVQSGGLLTVNAMGILTIEGASGFNSGGMLNQGTVTVNAGGLLRIGLTVSPGQYGLVNEGGTFNNAGETSIDRTSFSGMGLWNKAGSTFTNTGKVTIGGGVGINGAGLYNEAVFQNNGGELNIDRFYNAGIHNLAGSSITNTGKIAIGKTAAGGGAGIYNFATFNNNMGSELSIDRTYAGIDNRQHSSFINAGKIAIGAVASISGPGLYNASNFQNNGGEISIDRSNGGITNYDSSTVTNSGKITIGTKGKIQYNPGIYNYTYTSIPPYYAASFPIFNNDAGGEIIIDSTNNQAALHHGTGIFTNSGKITIGVTSSINGPGLYNQAVFNNNSNSEIYIDGITISYGSALGNDRGTFTNAGKIVIGAAFGAGQSGVYNSYNSVFTNNSGAEISIDRISIQTFVFNSVTYEYSGNGVYNSNTFTNSGKITIGSAGNGGANGLYHSGGVFTNNSGAEISIDHIFDSGSNSNGLYSNSTFTNSGKITIGNAANGGIHGLFNANVFSNNSGAEISIDHVSNNDMYGNSHGLFNTNTFTNAGKITIGTTASAGHNGLYNTRTFNNNAGAEITINHVMDPMTPLNTHGLRNGSGYDNPNFTNAGKITIGNTASAGQWGLWNANAFNNTATGEINISRSDTCGLRNGSYNDGSNFTNAGKIVIGAAGSAGNYGLFNSSTFSNSPCSARIEVISDNIIVAPGTFSNAGTIVENAGGNSNITSNTGIVQNLNGGVFSIGSGNAAITVPGYLSACGAVISGIILWEHDGASGVKDVSVKLTGDTTATALTPLNGAYAFAVTNGSNFTITPTKNINKLNGLTVADATAIQQHVANIAMLPAPFKRIAADVNKSNSINTLDASLINQVLLGNPQANAIFNTSWRFVPSSYSFLNPNVPWGFPEKITLTGVNGLVNNQDFYGIKLGDVVSTWANPANFGKGEPLVFRVPNRLLQAGTEVTAEFRADQLNDLNAFQFALRFDPEQVELEKIDIETSGGLPLSIDNFGTYNLANGEIRVVWSQTTSVQLNEATPLFRLRFKALESGAWLSEVLQLQDHESSGLTAYSYNSAFAESGVELRYTESTGTNQGGILPDLTLDNRPNPFTDMTTLRFVLPQAGAAELRVYDVSGRLLFSQKKTYTAGQQMETLRLEGVSGVLFVELVTEQGSVLRKMLAVK